MRLAINLTLSLGMLALCVWLVWPNEAARAQLDAAITALHWASFAPYLAAYVGLQIVVQIARSVRWNNLLAPLGVKVPTGPLLASRIARMECRVKPLRDGNDVLLEQYEAVFGAEEFVLVDVTATVLERATELRARHGFKTPDAIPLASAIEAGAEAFLTDQMRP